MLPFRAKSLTFALISATALAVAGGICGVLVYGGFPFAGLILIAFAWPAFIWNEIIFELEDVFGPNYTNAGAALSWIVWLGILYVIFLNRELRKEEEAQSEDAKDNK